MARRRRGKKNVPDHPFARAVHGCLMVLTWPIRRTYEWVVEPIVYRPKLASLEEVRKVVREHEACAIEPFYRQLIARGNPGEIERHIDQLKLKVEHNKKVLNGNGKGRYAKEYRLRKDMILKLNIEHIDTIGALEEALGTVRAEKALQDAEALTNNVSEKKPAQVG